MTKEELKQSRLSRGLTQQELGLRLGFEPTNARKRVYEYESGRRPINSVTEVALKSILQ